MNDKLMRFFFPRARCLCCNEPRAIDIGMPLCDSCREELAHMHLDRHVCPHCLSPLSAFDPCRHCSEGGMQHLSAAYAPFRYHGVSQKLVSRLKFGAYVFAAEPLAEGMLSCFPGRDIDILVPVPLHKSSLRKRGFNQSEILCQLISKAIGIPYQNALVKTIKTKRQSSLGLKKREKNVKDAFMAIESLCGKRVMLVDDVRTTGSTARACAGELLKAGAIEVCLLTATVASPYSK